MVTIRQGARGRVLTSSYRMDGGPAVSLQEQDVRLAPGGAEVCLDPPSQDGLWVLLMAPTLGLAMGILLSPRVSGTVPSHGSSWEKGTYPGVSQET